MEEQEECVIEERECVIEERECVTHAKDVLTSFEGMKNDEQFCDFILKIGEEEIPVHRMVLAACSKYFHAMFSNDTKEAKTGRAEIVGIETSAGKQCLQFAYTGKIKFSRENPKDLIHAAELMQLHSLIDLYFEYLVENISIENCLEYMVLALNQNSFAKIFEKFLGENFAEITKSGDFASMSQALLSQCLDTLRDGTQNSEKLIWEAVTTWVKADLENRKDDFPGLFKLIKLENLPTEYIKNQISREPLVMQSNECIGLVYHAVFASDQPEKHCGLAKAPTHVVAYNKTSRLLHKYDMKSRKWSRFTRVPAGIIGDDSDIFSFKGEIYVGSATLLLKYCDGTWVKVLDTECDPGYCKFTLCDPLIYITTQTCLVEYNTETKASEKCEIPLELRLSRGFMTGVSKSSLYAIGGSSTGKKAIEFDFTTKTWEPICCTNYDWMVGALLFYQGKLIALGGSSSAATAKRQPISYGFPFRISSSSGTTSGGSSSDAFGFGVSSSSGSKPAFSFGKKQAASSCTAPGVFFGPVPVTQTSSSRAAPSGIFGSTSHAAPSGIFGSSSHTAPSGAFGSSSHTAPSGTFGSSSHAAPSGLSFGSSSRAAPSGLSFGSSSRAAPSGLSFGSSSRAEPSDLSFGSSSRAEPSGLSFGSSSRTEPSGFPFVSSSHTSLDEFDPIPATQTSSSGSQTSHVEYYEPSVDKWIVLPSLKGNSFLGKNFKLFAHSDKLYVICSGAVEIEELEIDFGNTDAESRTLYSSLLCFV